MASKSLAIALAGRSALISESHVAIRGGYALNGETEVTLHSDTVKQRPQYKLAGGHIKGRSVHCLVTWDRDERKTGDVMVRWDDSSRSVDL